MQTYLQDFVLSSASYVLSAKAYSFNFLIILCWTTVHLRVGGIVVGLGCVT